MLEEWLLEEMQPRSQLRVGTWIAPILWFHLAPMFALGLFAYVREMQLGIHLTEGSSIGLHTE